MAAAKWGLYERLRPSQVETIRDAASVAYVPWGALEWHSYHNPIGLDGIKAHGLCIELAKATGGVVLPPFYLGTDTIKPLKGFKHTLDHGRALVREAMEQVLDQLADEGFRVIVLLTGHYGGGHVEAMNEACAAFAERHPDVGIWGLADWQPLEGLWPMNHAAHGETSFCMHFAGSTVDLSALPDDRVTTLDDDGVWGDDPREASGDAGAQMTADFVERAAGRVRELLERHRG
jgi:creatinine amidohydrolase